MTTYTPDSWQIIKINTTPSLYKILGGWSGSYLHVDSWRINSGIKTYIEHDEYISFIGHSGSVYNCHKDNERMTMLMSYIYEQLPDTDTITFDQYRQDDKSKST
jgi:hypothetical protein